LSRRETEEPHIRRMADLLRQGSTLTELACPACSSPLFRLKNDGLWCERCGKKVVVVKHGEEASKITGSMALESLEATLLAKVQEIQDRMQRTENPEELQKLDATLSGLLENIEKIRKVQKT
jgi:UPF0148 protein